MNIPDGRDSLGERDTANRAAAAADGTAHNTIPRLLRPVRGGGKKGDEWGSYRVYFFACAFRARFAAAGRRGEKERPELKKWNKHANAGHFPSLSLRAECECTDLTALTPATRWKKTRQKGEGEIFFSFTLRLFFKMLRSHEWRVNWMPWWNY